MIPELLRPIKTQKRVKKNISSLISKTRTPVRPFYKKASKKVASQANKIKNI
jgi:hypothetical protein